MLKKSALNSLFFRIRDDIEVALSETMLALEECLEPVPEEKASEAAKDRMLHFTARLSFLTTSRRDVDSLLPAV